jgi:replicative DNA helicase
MATSETTFAKGKLISEESERAILGAVLLDNSALEQASELLSPDDFALDSHRHIYRRMREMSSEAFPIDVVTLATELIRQNELEAIGGASYLSSLTDGLPRVANIGHYVKVVRDKSLLRRLIHTANNIISTCADAADDAGEILDRAESEVFSLGQERIQTGFVHVKDIFEESFKSLDALHDRGKRVTGIETGFREFDDMTRGLQPGDMVVIAARPSMGKTSFALDVARWVAVHEKKAVGVFSIEMSAPSLVLRLLCSEADVDSHRLQTGFASREDWTKLALGLGRLFESQIYIDSSPGLSLMEMRAKGRRLKAEIDRQAESRKEQGAESVPELGMLVIDYLQLMRSDQEYESRTQEVSAISRGIKSLAKELNIPVIAVSQLSRASEKRDDGRPKLSDLRESGQIEQDADLVAFIYREEMVHPTEDNRGRAELIIAKQRNGPTGTVNLVFLPQYTSFRNPPEAFGPSE